MDTIKASLLLVTVIHVCHGHDYLMPHSNQLTTDLEQKIDEPGQARNKESGLTQLQHRKDMCDKTEKNHVCSMSINRNSSVIFENAIEVWGPNFARFSIRFPNRTVKFSPGAIRAKHWVWTYYSPGGFFPYLKWPEDFPILSFGLLEAKTLPAEEIWMDIEVHDKNCSIVLGEWATTVAIGRALKNLTYNYLLHLNKKDFSYTYWCYLAEVPGIRDTIQYQLGIYIGFPVEFVRYNCCRTDISRYNQSIMCFDCQHQVSKMFQCTIIPYVIGLIAFAYFPVLLFSASGRLVAIGKRNKRKRYNRVMPSYSDDARVDDEDISDDGDDAFEKDASWVFLDGTPPISFTILVGGVCGLVDRHPVLVSRIRRTVFVIFGPIIIYIQVFVYYKYQPYQTLDLIKHGVPMGYLSMIGGFEKSKDNFLPVFGGPFLLLMAFYVAGFIFLVIPTNPDAIVDHGAHRQYNYGNISPLLYDIEIIERYSTIPIQATYGYARVAALCRAGMFMLTNHNFWFNVFRVQYTRIKRLFTLYHLGSRKKLTCALCLCFLPLLPVYLVICILELIFCILYYGVPLVQAICLILVGYTVNVTKIFRTKTGTARASRLSKITNSFIFKTPITIIVTCLLIYYVFSFCTIFTGSFSFIAQVVVFSFIAVIVYPSSSFGYLFFGIVFFYYILKMLQGFGEGYVELLADTVEICLNMEHEVLQTQIIDGTIIIDNTREADITKLQVHNRIINLSTDQRQQIRSSCTDRRPEKVIFKNHAAGIPRELFEHIVAIYRPVHIQIAQAALRLCLILTLIAGTISIVEVRPYGLNEGISEVMHVVFIMAIGALPRILEVALDNTNHNVRKEIEGRKLKATILHFWRNKNANDNFDF